MLYCIPYIVLNTYSKLFSECKYFCNLRPKARKPILIVEMVVFINTAIIFCTQCSMCMIRCECCQEKCNKLVLHCADTL